VDHRARMQTALGRDPGLAVAAIDFLTNVRPMLTNPTVVELSDLERTRRTAITDPLTGLFNRRHFQGALEGEIRRSLRYSLGLSLIMLDLDDFKSVNDLYGHPFGDLVLCRVGRSVVRAIREFDVPCRFGGEEFAIILPETDRLGALAVGERLRRRLERESVREAVRDRVVALTVSGGVACFPEDGTSSADLIANADRALYRAKNEGKNRVVIYHDERRRAVRFPAERATSVSVAAARGDGPRPAEVINLSSTGALLEAVGSPPALEAVEVAFGETSPLPVVAGRVVRVERDSGDADRVKLAIEFDRPLPDESLMRHVVRGRTLVAAGGGTP